MVAVRSRFGAKLAALVRLTCKSDAHPGSVEIAGMGDELAKKRALISQPACNEMHDLAFLFEPSVDCQQVRTEEFTTLTLGEIAPDHHIDHAGLVLEGDEGHATG